MQDMIKSMQRVHYCSLDTAILLLQKSAQLFLPKYVPNKASSDECFKAVILRKLRCAALQHYHDTDGHGSVPKTWQKLCRYGTWLGKKAQVYSRTHMPCLQRAQTVRW